MSVRLESPFPLRAVPRIWAWIESFRERVLDDYAPQTLEAFVADWYAQTPFRSSWAVWEGDELGGAITWEAWPQPGIGVAEAVFKPAFWPRAQEALGQAYAGLFAQGARKILIFPFRGNAAIIALYRALGARQEGILKAQTMRQGRPASLVILSVFKEDFERWVSGASSEKLELSGPGRSPHPSVEAAVSRPLSG